MLNKEKLNIIITIQTYAKFLRSESHILNRDINNYDWVNETQKYYNSLPSKVLERQGLKKNNHSFEKVLYYKITDEIMTCEESNLEKFNF